jgi:hypothetical protein
VISFDEQFKFWTLSPPYNQMFSFMLRTSSLPKQSFPTSGLQRYSPLLCCGSGTVSFYSAELKLLFRVLGHDKD